VLESVLTLSEPLSLLPNQRIVRLPVYAGLLLSHFRTFFRQVQHGGLFAVEPVSCAFKCTARAVFVALCHMKCLGRQNFADFKIYKICANVLCNIDSERLFKAHASVRKTFRRLMYMRGPLICASGIDETALNENTC
jgi:hypothetical protein